MPKRILRYEDNTVSCDIMFVLSGSSNITGHEKLTKTYNCSNARSNVLQPKSDYECMLYAMLTNPNCKGYLLLSTDAQQLKIGKLLQNERKRIWYKTRTNRNRFHVNLSEKRLFSSKEIASCKKIYQELALFRQMRFTNYKNYLNESWQKPLNVEIVLNALLWNGKGRFVCFYEEIKMFYVPVKYREVFLAVASIFSKFKMPNDIAVPTILKSLDLESTFINISTS